jgi:hypothetical protein
VADHRKRFLETKLPLDSPLRPLESVQMPKLTTEQLVAEIGRVATPCLKSAGPGYCVDRLDAIGELLMGGRGDRLTGREDTVIDDKTPSRS